MAIHNNIGWLGEVKAAQILKDKGYMVLETNWHMGHLELDIIAENKTEIAFVEVKTRTSVYGNKTPEEYVDEIKKRRVIAAANAYIKYKHIDKSPRFDIIGLVVNPYTREFTYVNHIENAFIPRVRTVHANSFSGRLKWKHRNHIIR